ncbi:hypothetical protein LGN04_30060, partial [Burkholderia multivorans]|nr:hypothetical protein [Burkholderia multivorans]
HGGFLELRRVHLVRYLEHFFFPSFRSSLYATCWKAKFQGKLKPLSIRDAKGLAQVLGDIRTASLASALIDARQQQELALEQALVVPETPMQTEGLQKRG